MLRVTPLHSDWHFAARSWLSPLAPAKPGDRAETSWYGYGKLEWLPAKVPGHVHLDLIENGVIPDPHERAYELGVAWVDEEDFVYETEFDYAPDAALPRALLRFNGLDTVCRVLLNGELLATHDNMFVPLELEVGERLVSGKNRLTLEFASAARVGRERRARYLAREAVPESVLHFEERAFVRKAQYMFGWDWGPRLVSCGIWGAVELVQFAARLLDVHVAQNHLPDGSVELRFQSRFEGNGRVLHWFEGVAAPIADGSSIRLKQPELWWPAGLGEQRLYALKSLLLANTDAAEGAVCDRRDRRVGLRRVRLVREDDQLGQSFEFEVNGRRIWSLGANWIPDSSFPASVTRQQVRRQIERARDMNMNMLRVWGGGLYESDDFYDACDDLGLLVWQDFPYACCYYPDDEAAERVAREEASSALLRLRQHPSVAFYCGNNENLIMYQDKWTDDRRHPPRYYGEAIYERVLREVVAELAPDVSYLPTSPCGREQASANGVHQQVGDQHYWDVWHGRGDWKFYEDSGARFASEFGFAAAPQRKTWQAMIPCTADVFALPVRHPSARWHDKTRKGYDTFIGYVELHYPRSHTIGDWLYFSQLNQRDALRHGIEHYRRSDFCKGTLIWQLNDCWPAQSWAVLDSAGELKAAAHELRRLYAPLLLSLERAGERVRLWAVLDNAREGVECEVLLEARSLTDGAALAQRACTVKIAPGERRVVLELALDEFEPATTLISAAGGGSRTFRLLSEPKDAELAQPNLRASVSGQRLLIATDRPVIDLFVWDDAGDAGFVDNFITLAQAGEVAIPFTRTLKRLKARSLRGVHDLSLASE